MELDEEAAARLAELREGFVREVNAAIAQGRSDVVAQLVVRCAERAQQIASAA